MPDIEIFDGQDDLNLPDQPTEGIEKAAPVPEAIPPPPIEPPPSRADQMVPLQALYEEKERRRAAESEARQFREQQIAINERLRVAQEMDEARRKMEEAPPPDEREYPIEHQQWKTQRLEQELAAIKQQQAEYAQQSAVTTQSVHLQNLAQRFDWALNEANKDPNFIAAANEVARIHDAALGTYGVPPEQRPQILRRLLFDACVSRDQFGNPADLVSHPGMKVMEMYQGFQRGQNGNGAPPEQHERAPADERLAQIQRGQRAAGMPSGASGSGGGSMTLERFANLNDQELSDFMRKSPNQFWALMNKLPGTGPG